MAPVYGSRFTRAVALAHEWHFGRLRKGTQIPYVSHLLAVAALVMEDGGSEDEVVAALLHDAAEDCGGDAGGEYVLARIEADFGAEVARLVAACSDSTSPQTEGKAPWAERKVAYLRHLHGQDRPVLLVSAADKLHNARAMMVDLQAQGPALWSRFNAGPARILWYHDAVLSAVREPLAGTRIAAGLEDVVGQLYWATGEPRPTDPPDEPPADRAATGEQA